MLDKPDILPCDKGACVAPARSIPEATPVQFRGSGFYTTDRGEAMIEDYEAFYCRICEEEVDTFFDRELCPHPCNTMHDRCRECGTPIDYCKLDEEI